MSLDEITRSVKSSNGHLKHGNTWSLRKHVFDNTVFTRASGEDIGNTKSNNGESND